MLDLKVRLVLFDQISVHLRITIINIGLAPAPFSKTLNNRSRLFLYRRPIASPTGCLLAENELTAPGDASGLAELAALGEVRGVRFYSLVRVC